MNWTEQCETMEQAHPALHDFLEMWGKHCGAPRTVFRGHLCKLLQALTAPRAEVATQWIMVEDRLPDNGSPVIVYERNASHMRRCAYYDTIAATGWHWCGYEGACNPDAWMPIPSFSMNNGE